MKDRDRQITEHIIRHCDEVVETAERFNCSEERFKSDHVFYNACSMAIFQVGELANRLTDDFKAAHAELPWREMRGMRNLFAHEYDTVDKDSLWGTVQNDIPTLREQLKKILQTDA